MPKLRVKTMNLSSDYQRVEIEFVQTQTEIQHGVFLEDLGRDGDQTLARQQRNVQGNNAPRRVNKLICQAEDGKNANI